MALKNTTKKIKGAADKKVTLTVHVNKMLFTSRSTDPKDLARVPCFPSRTISGNVNCTTLALNMHINWKLDS